MAGSASMRPPSTAWYEPASRHTGQSEPNMSRSTPNHEATSLTNGRRSSGDQVAQSASVTIPDSLTATFGWAASAGQAPAPPIVAAVGYAWLGDVVKHELQAGELPDRFDGGGQFPGADQQVVAEAAGLHGGEAAVHVRAREPVRVGLVVDLVTHADQPAAAGVIEEGVKVVGDAGRGQVDPADDAVDEAGHRRQVQEFARLGHAG